MMCIGPDCVVKLSGPHLALMAQVRTNLSRSRSFRPDWLDSFQSLPIQNTTIFGFIQPPRYPFAGVLRPQSCAQLLIWMPALEQITLDASVAPSFIRALEPVDGDLLCPKLRYLILVRRADHKVDLRNSLRTLSQRRKGHGCTLRCGIGAYGSSGQGYKIVHLEVVV